MMSSLAEIPDHAKIDQIVGPNDLSMRRGTQLSPVRRGSLIRKIQDALILSATGRTFAKLEFFDRSNRSLGLQIQADTRNELTTHYYFPCTLNVGYSAIARWLNRATKKTGCVTGIRVQGYGRTNAKLPMTGEIYALEKSGEIEQLQIAQRSRRGFQYYCSVASDSGESWLKISRSSDPCKAPLQECQTSGGSDCKALTLDRWRMGELDITAIVTCENNQPFTARGTGETMEETALELWESARAQGATYCSLRVIEPGDIIVPPEPSNEDTLVQIYNVEPCFEVHVNKGAASARSIQKPQGVFIKKGQKYTYCHQPEANEENNGISAGNSNATNNGTSDRTDFYDHLEPFDNSVESIEVQVFHARERGYQLCNQQQASGGQEGDRRTIQLTATEGIIQINYQMYDVEDRLQVIYEGRNLIDTGFISGRDKISMPFKGNSGQVEVIITGNTEIDTTKWDYTLKCPL
ncbi:hypothetical protein [Spirulina sp. 06S082]|uniref:hypothetical protein n=1 Tax=Spirulina sp. 06S082 TaxID=3110248 RepID=UPI002B2155B8|nr:hypothetical protein [Spirulina sp. 06S082]MEA5469425.1 hypothetical protein [Spirulina sp. 06S082]